MKKPMIETDFADLELRAVAAALCDWPTWMKQLVMTRYFSAFPAITSWLKQNLSNIKSWSW